MVFHRVIDWDSAYANGANIAGSQAWPAAWDGPATAFRETMTGLGRARLDVPYGPDPRQRYDLYLPEATPKGLVAYIHGGYWMAFDKSTWSHLAQGALAHGHAVVMPSYRLCPEVKLADIVADVAAALTQAAGEVAGPIRITGHSAGGHLAARMASKLSPLAEDLLDRIAHVVPISGLFDLRPLMNTAMNATLKIDDETARLHGPALLAPIDNLHLTAWVGGAERAEFRRQNALIANVWTGLGVSVAAYEEPDKHHFTVVDGLADPDHPLTRTLLT